MPPVVDPNLILDIKHASRDRNYFMAQRVAIDGRMGAHIRGMLGWHKKHPQRQELNDKAAELIDYGRKLLARQLNDEAIEEAKKNNERPPRRLQALGEPDPLWVKVGNHISRTLVGLEPIQYDEDKYTERLELLAAQLPVAAWWKEHVFDSTRLLGWLIAETGDLFNYPNNGKPLKRGVDCLCKRMGVAVMAVMKNGKEVGRVRQGSPGPNATDADWVAHGFRDKRRAVLAVIGGNLMRQPGGHYKAIYDFEREKLERRYEADGVTILPAAQWKKKKADPKVVALDHVNKDAKRRMEKKFLHDLWHAWRDAGDGMSTSQAEAAE